MTTQATIQKELEKLKEAIGTKKRTPVMVNMWCVDRGDGKNGFARFNLFNPKDKTPLTEEEVKQLRGKKKT